MDETLSGRLPARILGLDRLRGIAVLLMVVYHFSFDLDQYGWIHQLFNTDLRWLAFRALIISLFMGALGCSVVLAHPGAIRWRRLGRRQLELAGACLATSLGSAAMFPQSYIWFGILHFALVATLLALPLRRLGWPLLPAAALVAWAGNGPAAALFDTPWLGWIGFMTHKPYTEDYVPIFPWFAAVMVGVWIGGGVVDRGSRREARRRKTRGSGPAAAPGSGAGPVSGPDRTLRFIGRHTLLIYLAHQPILIGILEALAWCGVRAPGH